MESQDNHSKKILLSLILISASLFIFDKSGFFNPLVNNINHFLIPVQEKIYQKKISFLNSKNYNESLLQEENRRLVKIALEIDSLRKENQEMRRLLNAPLPTNWKYIPAAIAGENQGVLIINRGTKDKVFLGAIAIYDGFYIGRVTKTNENFSLVSTIFNPHEKILVNIKNPEEQKFFSSGLLTYLGNKIRLQKILLKDNIIVGDIVTTAQDSSIPIGLPIGKISTVSKEDNEIFQEAEIEPYFSLKDLSIVFILNYP